MSRAIMKIESESETCSVCGGGGDLFTPEEHDVGAPPMQTPLRTMLLHLNNNKVIPEGRLCNSCIQRAIEAYEFSTALAAKGAPPLSEKIHALRQKLHELTQKIDVFIVVGGPGMNSGGGSYSEDDIIMVERDALSAAAAADEEDLERAKNACGETVFQCTVCPMTFQRASEFRTHKSTHPASARHSCWTCGSQFATCAALRDHARQHDAPAPLVCNVCDTTYQSLSALRAHESVCCSRCPACGAACAGRAGLSRHVQRAHASPPALCPVCFVRLSTRAQQAQHALTHRQADRFVCGYDACILRFANRSDLMAHIRKCHSGEVMEVEPQAPAAAAAAAAEPAGTNCPHCTRTFGSVAAMKRHARVHRRERQSESINWQIEPLDGDVEYLEMEALEELSERD